MYFFSLFNFLACTFAEEVLKQQVLAFLLRLMNSHELDRLDDERKEIIGDFLKRMATKYLLRTMEAEVVVDLLCAIEAALRTGLDTEIDTIVQEVRDKLECSEQSVQGEVCVFKPKSKDKRG